MATMNVIFLFLMWTYASGLSSPPVTRNTIFGDEKQIGEIFENIDTVKDDADNYTLYRLPTTTRPKHYDILWTIDTYKRVFDGQVDIELYATQPNVSEIVIHAHEMNYSFVELKYNDAIISRQYSLLPEAQFMRIILQNSSMEYNASNPVVYVLSVGFNAALRKDMLGIYESWYRNPGGEEKWMATTQFQATAARKAFPCYDEPSFKATFNITIRRPTELKSWSLTRKLYTENATLAGYQNDVYSKTPVMSTYLLALIVADYDSITLPSNVSEQLHYEVIGRRSVLRSQGNYALYLGKNLTEVMGIHTGKDYFSLHENLKMTHAAIPDFDAGAMENFGLITYREAYLMYDTEHTNDYFKQIIAYILSHEIAHMWFGNWVTCDFWDSLWLNEGFARYYQYFLTHWVEGYMGLDSRFINEQLHTSLLADSSDTAHALTNPKVGSPSSIRGMFDTITYNKGASVIRMTEHLLGSEILEMGLQKYLADNAYKTARPIDLFEALQNVSLSTGAISQYRNFSFIEYYRSWTEQAGHPIVNVQVNHKTGDMVITQRRFNINTGFSRNNKQYVIPLSFTSADNIDFNNLKPSHIMRDGVIVINRGSVGNHWVIFNKQQTGFYRVNYDDYTWDLITAALRSSNRTLIHEYNRAQIVNDVFQFARSGIMSYNKAFNILSFLENETEYTPWVAAITGFNWLRNRFAGTNYLAPLEELITKWASTVMNQLTYYPRQNDTFMTSYLRYQLAPFMCRMNVRRCLDAAESQFRALVNNQTEVPVNSRNWVYCHALRLGSKADFDYLWQRFNTHNVYTEKILLLMTLGCTNDEESLNTLLNNIVEENFVIRKQDYTTAFNTLLNENYENVQIAFRFIQRNLTQVLKAFDGASPITNIASRLRSSQDINAFKSWASQNNNTLGNYYKGIVEQAQSTQSSLDWAVEVQDDIGQYLQEGDTEITTTTFAPPTTPQISTISPPPLVEPDSPNLPDSSVTTMISLSLIIITAIVHYLI
ncbi:aminopeptidase N3 precursor [Danaus plexippus plexippus]|uniref:Aminopeptidase n=1 Tax=Danaus plexippus plexippus TaxID=278856 RepID=A0A212EJT4_DANPL|nr:aminopeptidase N3 precursor [Danaus plexippus plexippus]